MGFLHCLVRTGQPSPQAYREGFGTVFPEKQRIVLCRTKEHPMETGIIQTKIGQLDLKCYSTALGFIFNLQKTHIYGHILSDKCLHPPISYHVT